MHYIDIIRFLLGVISIVAAGYWSVAASTMTNTFFRISSKLFAFAIMIAGALQIALAINAYV